MLIVGNFSTPHSLQPAQTVCVVARRGWAAQGYARANAARQGPAPWEVDQLEQQSTSWQQRQQQQQQQQQQQRYSRQRRRRQQQTPAQQQLGQGPHGPAPSERANRTASQLFTACPTYQAVYMQVQQLVTAVQQQQQGQHGQQQQHLQQQQPVQQSCDAHSGPSVSDQQHSQELAVQQQQQVAAAAVNELALPQGQQVQQVDLSALLSAEDFIGLIRQLSVIAGKQSSSSSTSHSPGINPFVEDQALQHTLAMVYAVVEQQLQQPQEQTQSQQLISRQEGSRLSGQQLLWCVSVLAGLKYSQPSQLTSWLEAAAAAHEAAVSSAPPLTPPSGAAEVSAAGGVSAAAAGASITSHRQLLQALPMWQLAALVSNLARAGVRPSNVWLLAFMQVVQQKLQSADLPQLAQLLSGLVKVGVKPSSAWMEVMEGRVCQCLLAHAVQQQLADGQQEQEQQQQQQQQQQAGGVPLTASSSHSRDLRQRPVSQRQRAKSCDQGPSSTDECSPHHVARLLMAFADARHTPQPQLSAVLWGATASSLGSADTCALVELLQALAELQVVPPSSWLQQYLAASSEPSTLQQYKPWQLSSSMASLGSLLAAAARTQQRDQQASPQQQAAQLEVAGVQGVSSWVVALMAAAQQQLHSFAGRDLAALLSGLAALQVPVGGDQLGPVLQELQVKLPRLNTAALADTAEAVAALVQQQQRQPPVQEQAQEQYQKQLQLEQSEQKPTQQQLLLPDAAFLQALLREVAMKLPVFPAHDLARVVLAVAACGVQPGSLWVEAVAAQLSSKVTLLEPGRLVDVVDTLAALGPPPGHLWLLHPVAALDGRLMQLSAAKLLRLLALLVSVGTTPGPSWLDQAEQAVLQHAAPSTCTATAMQEAGGPHAWLGCQQLLRQLRERQQAPGFVGVGYRAM